ncbi:hypothetical protein SCA03_33280 [Streptomyces cacaoi]|uniref:Uncharacterized protein n=1 Tax=Streptomyces cacaoi TaxID=1898 RepID=A0A4Y3R1I5_STRCI|nr:hypothetical protein SCA03_33280 [Streptomyces cacaoi]
MCGPGTRRAQAPSRAADGPPESPGSGIAPAPGSNTKSEQNAAERFRLGPGEQNEAPGHGGTTGGFVSTGGLRRPLVGNVIGPGGAGQAGRPERHKKIGLNSRLLYEA